MVELNSMSDRELLNLYARVMRVLRDRGAVTSSNNPVADVTEGLAAAAFGLTLASNSERGFDGTDSEGVRYQIKGRRLTPENPSTEVSIVRCLEDELFNYFLVIYFDEFWNVHEAVRLTHAAFARHASFSAHRNGHRFTMKRAVRADPEFDDVTTEVAAAWC